MFKQQLGTICILVLLSCQLSLQLTFEPQNLGLKWKKSGEDDEYFIQVSKTKWEEYHQGALFAEFDQIENIFNTPIAQIPYVILKRTDGLYILLLTDKAYFGNSRDDIRNYLADGHF